MNIEQLKLGLTHLKKVCKGSESVGVVEDLFILAAIRALRDDLEMCSAYISKEGKEGEENKADLKFLFNISLFDREATIKTLDTLSSKDSTATASLSPEQLALLAAMFNQEQLAKVLKIASSKDSTSLSSEQLDLLATFGLSSDTLQAISTELKTLNLKEQQDFLQEYYAVRLTIIVTRTYIEIKFYNLFLPFYKELENFFKEELFKGVPNKVPDSYVKNQASGKAIVYNPADFGRWWCSIEEGARSDIVKSLIFMRMNFPDNHYKMGKDVIPTFIQTITTYLWPDSTESVELPTVDFSKISRGQKYTIFKRLGLTLEQCKNICKLFESITSKNGLREFNMYVEDNIDIFNYKGEEESTKDTVVPGLFSMFSSGSVPSGFPTSSGGPLTGPITRGSGPFTRPGGF